MKMTKIWPLTISAFDDDNNYGGVVTTMMQCSLLNQMMGGIIQVTLRYRSNIGPEGGGAPPPPLELAAEYNSDPVMPLGIRGDNYVATAAR